MSQQWEAAFEAHLGEALALPLEEHVKPHFDLPTYIREAHQTLQLARDCWEQAPEEGAPPLKRFEGFYGRHRLERTQGLLYALQHAVGVGLFGPRAAATAFGPKVARGRWLIREISGALGFVLDDGVDERADAQLRHLRRITAKEGGSRAGVGSALNTWVFFAREQRERLSLLEDFDFALLDEAETLRSELLGLVSVKPVGLREALPWARVRGALYTLALREMQALRRVVERAYRHHGDTLRRFASAERRRRRARAGAPPLTPPTA
jgi:hypothetical protein